MRSYYAHLLNTVPSPKISKPVLRASSLFPVFQLEGIKTRILFMGYWFIKRNIQELTQVTTLRKKNGDLVSRSVSSLTEAKAYRIELSDLMKKGELDPNSHFEGSIEVEFFSLQNLFFPFPALTVNYYGKDFSTVVHTAQRVYNNYEDMIANSETKVPEAGFNVYANDQVEPFIILINGPEKCPQSRLHVECFNKKGSVLKETLALGDLEPYSMHTVYLAQELPLERFLENQVGTMRIAFDVRWVFPRLLVGNRQKSPPSFTITHTYYDCTRASASSDYWYAANEEWYGSSLMVPLCSQNSAQTKIYFYPIYSPSSFTIDLEIYNNDGICLGKIPHALHILSPATEFEIIDAAALAKSLGVHEAFPLSARLIARPDPGTNLPARIKLALDIGSSSTNLPCNICTNLQPFNPSWEGKTHSFKWSPVLADQDNPEVWIMNSSPAVHNQLSAKCDLRFFRESDTATLERSCTIPPHGCVVISTNNDLELKTFLQGKIGWIVVVSTNPYTTTYYYSRPSAGIVGGDHGF